MVEGARAVQQALFYEGAHLIHRAPPVWTHHLSRTQLLTLSHWALGFNVRILEGHRYSDHSGSLCPVGQKGHKQIYGVERG